MTCSPMSVATEVRANATSAARRHANAVFLPTIRDRNEHVLRVEHAPREIDAALAVLAVAFRTAAIILGIATDNFSGPVSDNHGPIERDKKGARTLASVPPDAPARYFRKKLATHAQKPGFGATDAGAGAPAPGATLC